MKVKELRDLGRVQPFVPFTVRMASGQVHRVPHPDYLFITPNEDYVMIVKEGGGFHLLDPNLIEEAEIENRRQKRSKAA